MFESLSERLGATLASLTGKGRLSDKDIETALRQVRMALLEADVDFKVARQFVADIRESAKGEEVATSLTPGQTVVKIVQDKLVEILGGTSAGLERSESPPFVILLAGLQGAGKTTTAGKLALHLRRTTNQRVMLAACDLQRPAAVEQLVTVGKEVHALTYSEDPRKSDPVKVAKNALKSARKELCHWLILDTAGRLAIDDDLMRELSDIRDAVDPCETLLVMDAMTGQDAVNSGGEFNRRIGVTGIILTKMEGDARGGAALSMRTVTGVPIKFVTLGERPVQFEEFHPDRMAQRILGMGDVTTLIEKAQRELDIDASKVLEQRIRRKEFDLNDMLEQLKTVQRMGPLQEILGMIPGFRGGRDLQQGVDASRMKQIEAIILSMTPAERSEPTILNGRRKRRIANGSGTNAQQVNQLLSQYRQMQRLMRQLNAAGSEREMMRRLGGGGMAGMQQQQQRVPQGRRRRRR